MYAWMNQDGKWLTVRSVVCRGSNVPVADWTSDINRASVLSQLPSNLRSLEAIRVSVVEIRTVKVVVPSSDTVPGEVA